MNEFRSLLPTVEEALDTPGADAPWILQRIEEVLASDEPYAYHRLVQDVAEHMGLARPPGIEKEDVWPWRWSWFFDRHSAPLGHATLSPIFHYAARVKLIRLFSFAIPTPAAIKAMAAKAPIIELGAGSGYWAHLLQREEITCRPFDLRVGYDPDLAIGPWDRLWTKVEQGDVSMLDQYPDHTLLLCWPSPSTNLGSEAVKRYRGYTIIHVGAPGLTGDDLLYEELNRSFICKTLVRIPQWEGADDAVEFWERKKEG